MEKGLIALVLHLFELIDREPHSRYKQPKGKNANNEDI